jgi:hypothetical protein
MNTELIYLSDANLIKIEADVVNVGKEKNVLIFKGKGRFPMDQGISRLLGGALYGSRAEIASVQLASTPRVQQVRESWTGVSVDPCCKVSSAAALL